MNVRRGLIRVWLLATGVWFITVLGFTEAGYRATYAFQYYFQYDQLEQEASANYQQRVAEWQSSPLKGTMLEPDRPRLRDIPEPTLDWLALLLLPPTLGVALLYLTIRVLGKLFHWLIDGFRD